MYGDDENWQRHGFFFTVGLLLIFFPFTFTCFSFLFIVWFMENDRMGAFLFLLCSLLHMVLVFFFVNDQCDDYVSHVSVSRVLFGLHECVKKWDNEECEHGKVTKQEVFIYRVYGLNLRWQTSCFIAHFIWVIKVGWSCKNVLNREVHKKDSKVEIKPLLRLKHMVLFWEIFIKILFQVDKGISNVPLHSIQHPSSTLTQSGNF